MKKTLISMAAVMSLTWPCLVEAQPQYNMNQQIFVNSYLVNSVSSMTGSESDLQAELKERISAYFADPDVVSLIGNWELAWGPAVFQIKYGGDLANNAMYVAKQSGSAGDSYVAAVSATNPTSSFDWLVEDAWVGMMKKWPFGNVPKGLQPKISMGTWTGLNILLDLEDPSTKTELKDYLKAAANTKSTLYFAGHSLAGALSPTLALALFNEGAALKKSDWQSVYVYPTAGATPGNQDFSDLYKASFSPVSTGSAPYQQWNAMLWNSLDVVPHAWNKDDLSQIPTLYGKDLDEGAKLTIGAAVDTAKAKTLWHSYQRLPNQSLAGTQTATVTTVKEFFAQMGTQHVPAYPTLIGTSRAYCIMGEMRQNGGKPVIPTKCP